ncbi:hypothetical protein [Acuticoccus mangrovi]|uniref:Uncharacterized protein n=1 Tax=Acuticoccus mangrovi TaxID=2796142 RepID=A0A934MGH4_9HYPH|nr:hypothetical protein [Acuticoccus mangrovi]MBJ3775930.1 hypothetical protein [Acuticoccus mangrovi]
MLGISLSVSGAPSTTLGPAFDLCVDAENGDDGNDGSMAAPFATLAKLASVSTADDRVGLKRGSRFRETFSAVSARGIGAYGDPADPPPFIDGSDVVAATITAHATHADVYEVTITHSEAPYFAGSYVESNGPHFALWWEPTGGTQLGEYLEPYYGAADIAAGEAFVAANPGRMFVHKDGSTNPDARTEASGQTFRYVFQLADSGDPRTGGALHNAARAELFEHPGGTVSDLVFGRNIRKDCTYAVTQNFVAGDPVPVYRRCAWIDVGCHASLGVCHGHDLLFLSRTPGAATQGAAFHCYHDTYAAATPQLKRARIVGFSKAVYSHGSVGGNILDGMVVERVRAEGCRAFAYGPPSSGSLVVRDGVLIDGVNFVQGSMTADVDGFLFVTITGASPFGRALLSETVKNGIDPVFRNGFAVFRNDTQSGDKRCLEFESATPANNGRLTLQNVTVAGLSRALVYHNLAPITLEESAIGAMSTTDRTPNTGFVGIASQFGIPGSAYDTLAEIQAVASGVDGDCLLEQAEPLAFDGDPTATPYAPTISTPAIVAADMGVDPAVITALLAMDVPSEADFGR